MADSSEIKIKSENEQKFKPKFVPKVQVKKEPTNEPKQAPSSDSQPKNRSDDRKYDRRNDRGGRGNDRPGGRGGREGGRGHFVMPMGAAFFSGNSKTSAPVANKVTIGSNSTSRQGIPTVTSKTSAISSATDGAMDVDLPIKQESLEEDSFEPYIPQPTKEEEPDSDESDSEQIDYYDLEQSTTTTKTLPIPPEIWPPKNVNPLQPIALPFGPKTTATREALGLEPILADPNNELALEHEENETLYLVQLPSDLNLNKQPRNSNLLHLKADGHIGKLQLYKSGKVKLVTDNGLTYDVTSGLFSCFQQTVSIIDPQTPANNASNANVPSSSASSTHHNPLQNLHNNQNNTSETPGDLYFLGNITKKIVMTPEYELGNKKIHTNAPEKLTQRNQDFQTLFALAAKQQGLETADEMILDETLAEEMMNHHDDMDYND